MSNLYQKQPPRLTTMARMAQILFYIGLALLVYALAGCSANWHLKKAIAKKPDLLQPSENVKFDTVIVTEAKYLTDTVVLNDVDSVVITKDRVVTKIWRQYDTLRVETTCPGDTVRINIEKPCPPTITYTPKPKWHQWVLGGAIGAALAFFFLLLKRKTVTDA